jgi:hypothetical protein
MRFHCHAPQESSDSTKQQNVFCGKVSGGNFTLPPLRDFNSVPKQRL